MNSLKLKSWSFILSSTSWKAGIEWRSKVCTVDLSFARNVTIEKRARKKQKSEHQTDVAQVCCQSTRLTRSDVTSLTCRDHSLPVQRRRTCLRLVVTPWREEHETRWNVAKKKPQEIVFNAKWRKLNIMRINFTSSRKIQYENILRRAFARDVTWSGHCDVDRTSGRRSPA